MITWSSLSVNEKKQALARPAMANSQQLKQTVGDIIARVEKDAMRQYLITHVNLTAQT